MREDRDCLVVLGLAWFSQRIGHLHVQNVVQAVLVVIIEVAGNNCSCAANVLSGHKVENDPRQEGVEVLACFQAADVQRDSRVEDVYQVVQRPLK